MPIRTRTWPSSAHGSAASIRCASTVAATASAVRSKTTKNPSPSVATSTPSNALTAARISSRCRARSDDQRSSGRVWARRVEPSMSVKTKATVPVGRAVIESGRSSRRPEPTPSRSVLRGLGLRPEPGGQTAQDCEPDRRMLDDQPLELPAGEGQASGRLRRDDHRDPRQPVDHGHLAEEVTTAEPGQLLAVADHAYRAFDDDEEPGPDLALPGDHVLGREVDLDGTLRDGGEVVGADAPEQRAAAEKLGPAVLGERHGSSSDCAGC